MKIPGGWINQEAGVRADTGTQRWPLPLSRPSSRRSVLLWQTPGLVPRASSRSLASCSCSSALMCPGRWASLHTVSPRLLFPHIIPSLKASLQHHLLRRTGARQESPALPLYASCDTPPTARAGFRLEQMLALATPLTFMPQHLCKGHHYLKKKKKLKSLTK